MTTRARALGLRPVSALMGAVCLVVSACSTPERSLSFAPTTAAPPAAPTDQRPPADITRAEATLIPADHVFASSSLWRRPVGEMDVASSSAAQIDRLVEVLAQLGNGNAAFNVYQYGVSWYTVGKSQARTDVAYWNCQGKPILPQGLTGKNGQFTSIPIPDDAVPTPGSDASLSIYQPSTDTLWDLWKVYRDADGWHACWGGRIDDVSRSDGAFEGHFGASASGLAREAGVVSVRDARAGVIEHALALSLPPDILADGWVYPAKRGDGTSTSAAAIPEGTRLRLDPTVDVDALRLTPVGRLVARAAQTYGFIVTDRSSTVTISAEGPHAYFTRSGRDPWAGLLRRQHPSAVLAGFPWDRVEVVAPGSRPGSSQGILSNG